MITPSHSRTASGRKRKIPPLTGKEFLSLNNSFDEFDQAPPASTLPRRVSLCTRDRRLKEESIYEPDAVPLGGFIRRKFGQFASRGLRLGHFPD